MVEVTQTLLALIEQKGYVTPNIVTDFPIAYTKIVWGLQRSCAGRKWGWRQRHLRPAHNRWSPQTNTKSFSTIIS